MNKSKSGIGDWEKNARRHRDLCFTHKSQNDVGAKHVGDRQEDKNQGFSSQRLTRRSLRRYRFANGLPRDRMLSQVEGEAFAQKYSGASDKIKRECFAPTEFQEIWVKHRHRNGGIHRQENAAAFLKYTGRHGFNLLSFLLIPWCWSLLVATANALPGQTTDTVLSWITSNPTLRPGIRDGLIVNKNNSPAQRFTFQASVLPPGRINTLTDRITIRSERMTFYDQINGVTPERLRESLRAIYGSAIYQDFEQAAVVYNYPVPQTLDLARRRNRLLDTARQGELRLGERYAYWMEVTQTDTGKAFNGQLTIFLKEDVGKLEAELRDR